MTYKVILDSETKHTAHNIPFEYWEEVWYCYKKRKKYAVYKRKVMGIWATNMVGVILDNDEYVEENKFHRLFKNKNEAIDWCLKQNQINTVKVYE